jgi:hypothetical protein
MERSWELAVSPPVQLEERFPRMHGDRVLRPRQRLVVSRLNFGSLITCGFIRGPRENSRKRFGSWGADGADKYQSLEIVDGNRPADA